MGYHILEFGRILDYRDELLRTNPESTCVVKLGEANESGKAVFQSFYVCFGALKNAFMGCRKCIGLDGCFLKGVCRGQLLVVVAKDANNQMLPLAWAVMEYENKNTCTWFVSLLKDDLGLGDGRGFTLITDMQKGLLAAIQDIIPACEHRMCARHILANWSKNWRGIQRRMLFWKCARSTYEAELKKNLKALSMLGKNIVDDLLYYNKETWCKVYFNVEVKCDVVDNNMAESFNAWILAARHKTIITMLEEIIVKMMTRIAKLREFANTWSCNISPMALKVLEENIEKSMRCTIFFNGDTGYQVKEETNQHIVCLRNNICSCRAWMLKGIPCPHAIAAMYYKGYEPADYVDNCYMKETYLMTYSHFLQPLNNMEMWPASTNPPVAPPVVKSMPGRPKKIRRKEAIETKKCGKLPKTGLVMRCNICKGVGHNRRGCHKSATAAASSGSGTTAAEASGTTAAEASGSGRPRGRPKV
ncbi:uncharacterized protein LOC142165791 [Nicotiana tabacum]|uniref:Uncharacterized protein LOC142165791 n=1 Tax=Nicotiana tabacum TaxID=4097 RepID=A0AC58S5P8_TOBAC